MHYPNFSPIFDAILSTWFNLHYKIKILCLPPYNYQSTPPKTLNPSPYLFDLNSSVTSHCQTKGSQTWMCMGRTWAVLFHFVLMQILKAKPSQDSDSVVLGTGALFPSVLEIEELLLTLPPVSPSCYTFLADRKLCSLYLAEYLGNELLSTVTFKWRKEANVYSKSFCVIW